MTLSHIVAVAANSVIGDAGRLPWDIPEDLRFFRDTTRGHAVLMGRKTFESIGKALPGRLNVVMTRQKTFSAAGCLVAPDLEGALALCAERRAEWGDEVFVIGGGEIYRQTLGRADTLYVTRVHGDFAGAVTYPEIDPATFKLTASRARPGPVAFTFETYRRG